MARTRRRSSGTSASTAKKKAKVKADAAAVDKNVAATAEAFAAIATQVIAQLPDKVAADRTATADQPNRETRRAQKKDYARLLADLERRNRMQLLPHYAAAALIALTAAVQDMAAQVDALGTAALITAAVAGVGGVVGRLLLRRRQELLEQWGTWSALLCSATAIWMVVAVLTGITWPTFAAALSVEYAFGARWWAHHRHPEPKPRATPAAAAPVPGPIEIDDSLIALYARRWTDHVGGKGDVLQGATLVDGAAFENGIEYLLRLVPGKQSIDSVRSQMKMVASGLGVPESQLVVEEHGSRQPALVTFRVVTASPVEGDVFFRTPALDDGHIVLGPYADGIGNATWRLYSEDSMWGGLVIGGPGSGKSRLLEVIGLCALYAGNTYVIHVDGQDGASCPALYKHAHESYGQDDVEFVLARLAAMQKHRQQNRPEGVTGFTPTPEFPGILVIVDETHAVVDRGNVDRWAALAREARKVGEALLMGDQDGSLDTFIKAVLRASLKSGNCVGLRTEDRMQGTIVTNGKFNLCDLPEIPGFGYTLGDAARFAPFRGSFMPSRDNAKNRAKKGRPLPKDVVLVEDWYEHAPKISLDAATRIAGDQANAKRRTNSAGPGSAGGDSGNRVVPISAGHRPMLGADLPPFPTVADAAPDAAAALPPFPTVGPPVPAPAPAPDSAGGAAGTAPPPLPAGPAPTGPPPDALTPTQRAVLDCVARQIEMPGAIGAELQLSRQHVGTTLAALVDMEYVTKTGAGPSVRYHLVRLTA